MKRFISIFLIFFLLYGCSGFKQKKNYMEMAHDTQGSAIGYTQNTTPERTDELLGMDDPSGTWSINRFPISNLLNQTLSTDIDSDISAAEFHYLNGMVDGSYFPNFSGNSTDNTILALFSAVNTKFGTIGTGSGSWPSLSNSDGDCLSSTPTSPVAGHPYCADNDNWDPANIDGTVNYLVIYDGSNYVAIIDEDGNLLVSDIDLPAGSVDPADMSDADFGDFTCSGGNCTIDTGTGSGVPDGNNTNDILSWDGDSWEPIALTDHPAYITLLNALQNAGCSTPATGDELSEGFLGNGYETDPGWAEDIGTNGTVDEDYTLTGTPPADSCAEGLFVSVTTGNGTDDSFAYWDRGSTIAGTTEIDIYFSFKVNSYTMPNNYDNIIILWWKPASGTDAQLQLAVDGSGQLSVKAYGADSTSTHVISIDTWYTGKIHLDVTAADSYLLINELTECDEVDECSFTRGAVASQYLRVGAAGGTDDDEAVSIELGGIWVNTP